MEEKNLFIPLKREFWDKFQSGEKDHEYRKYGPRWNEGTCRVGRKATLSMGYGKALREERIVCGFEKVWKDSQDWISCYGKPGWCADIYLPAPPANKEG